MCGVTCPKHAIALTLTKNAGMSVTKVVIHQFTGTLSITIYYCTNQFLMFKKRLLRVVLPRFIRQGFYNIHAKYNRLFPKSCG